MKTHGLVILAALATLSSACSSSSDSGGAVGEDVNGVPSGGTPAANGDPDASSGDIVTFGFLTASYDGLDDTTEWSGQFFRGPSAFPLSSLGDEFVGAAVSDTCATIEAETQNGDFDGDVGLDNLPFVPETVSAGETITITSPAGTYATLTSQSLFGFSIYQTSDDVPVAGPIPAGSTADIPGAANGFPAFADVTVPVAAPLSFSVDGSTLAWTGSDASGGSINIVFGVAANGDIAGLTQIECDLVDDGSHRIADALLPAGSLEFPFSFGTRTVTLVDRRGDAVLILTVDAEGSLSP